MTILISYYILLNNNKVWLRTSPFRSTFVLEDPYTGRDYFSHRAESHKDDLTYVDKIPPLKHITKLANNYNHVLSCVLWLKDHKAYSDQIILSGFPFWRASDEDSASDDYLLIPLYARRENEVGGSYIPKNPVVVYNSNNILNALLVAHVDIYTNLKAMFCRQINAFSFIMNGKWKKWMVQFPNPDSDYPACFI